MKKRRFLYIILSLLGLCIAFYPVFSEIYHEKQMKNAVKNYEEQLLSEADENMTAILKAAQNYNSELVGRHIKNIYIPAERDEASLYYSLLNYTGDGCMGTVEIPCIDLTLPIYHFTDELSLESGAGHLQGSSMPIGGSGSHSVLIAHRGLPGKRLFTDLDKVAVGDLFYIRILGQTLAYEAVSTEVVSPDNADSLAIDEEKDQCTLVTCTPYAVNTMRLLVHGVRTEYKEGQQNEGVSLRSLSLHSAVIRVCFVAAGIAAAILISAVVDFIRKKCRKTERDETEY